MRSVAFIAMTLAAGGLLLAPPAPAAGIWSDPGTSVVTAGTNGAYVTALPPNDCGRPLACNQPGGVSPILPGFGGGDYGAYSEALCGGMVVTCPVIGSGDAWFVADGLGTSEFGVQWMIVARAKHLCECKPYWAQGTANMTALIDVTVSGVPAGQPVTVYYTWWGLVNNYYRPENPALPDDPASIQGVGLKLGGTDLIQPGSADFANQRALLFIPPPALASGSFTSVGGATIQIEISGNALAQIARPPHVRNNNRDYSDASFQGRIVLSIDNPIPPLVNPAQSPDAYAHFSLDIGSDTEMSDPTLDGNEVFDPGDLYNWKGPPLPAGGLDGPRDDAEIFFVDYWPQAPDGPPATTGADTCAGKTPAQVLAMLDDRFDLDGADELNASLMDVLPAGPLPTPVDWTPSSCIPRAEFLVISYDDDWSGHYAGSLCEVPVATASGADSRYGTTLEDDEVVGVNVSLTWPFGAGAPPGVTGAIYPIADEATWHMSMAPNPDVGEDQDDDVDALDIGSTSCEYWYFSPDHEATGIHPVSLAPLDPGSIYQVLGPPSYGTVRVVDGATHLGLPPGTDIDAFEFVCLQPSPTSPTALAVLFSVDDDDWMTMGVNESGGLDPRMVYASFMTGTYIELLNDPLTDDVDAITAMAVPFLPTPCFAGAVLYWADDFDSYPLGPLGGAGGWLPWINDPIRDADVSDLESSSAPQALQTDAADSVVQVFSGISSGRWTLEANVYLDPTAAGPAGLRLYNEYDPIVGPPPSGESVALSFDPVIGMVSDGLAGFGLPMATGTWYPVEIQFDLDNDDVQIYFDGQFLTQYPWTIMGGALELAAVNVESLGSLAYFDDFALSGVADCNTNGVADQCDILLGTSQDTNTNGIPDECEGPQWCLGDLNCSGGSPTFDDIKYFSAAIGSESSWWAYFVANQGFDPPCPWLVGDYNYPHNGVEFSDIKPFAASIGQPCIPYAP